MVTYFVGGRPQQSDLDARPQKEILALAGFAPEQYYLIGEDGSEYRRPDDPVPLKDGEKFEVKPLRGTAPSGGISYEVNGERQTAAASPVALREILEKAGREAGIDPAELEHYRLEDVSTGARYAELDAMVPVKDGDKFIAIYMGATPVA